MSRTPTSPVWSQPSESRISAVDLSGRASTREHVRTPHPDLAGIVVKGVLARIVRPDGLTPGSGLPTEPWRGAVDAHRRRHGR